MSIIDAIKNSVLEQFTGTVSIDQIVISLLIAFAIGTFIIYIYKKTYTGVVYSKAFALCIVLLAMVTSLVIRTISSNLALSLGMVGALSIVRFRTAIKEPVDTVFMFWAITGGIMSGAGLYLTSIIASLAVGLLYWISYLMGFKVASRYLFVLKYSLNVDAEVTQKLKELPKYKIRSKTISSRICELTFEMDIKENNDEILNTFRNMGGIVSASLISYQNDFGD
jgi:hypothetical protein